MNKLELRGLNLPDTELVRQLLVGLHNAESLNNKTEASEIFEYLEELAEVFNAKQNY